MRIYLVPDLLLAGCRYVLWFGSAAGGIFPLEILDRDAAQEFKHGITGIDILVEDTGRHKSYISLAEIIPGVADQQTAFPFNHKVLVLIWVGVLRRLTPCLNFNHTQRLCGGAVVVVID